ncbi:uncharacterized protein [Nicotiana tomentosiformis]|uniref:uncharacterized protein n=1 Tax=Nicotiana tomentosiformis TaxID=4098 RepID=UPI00388CD157
MGKTSKSRFPMSLTKDAILRPSSGEEETKSSVPKPGKEKKRKSASQSEDPKPKPRKCEIELQKVLEERNALKLLCSQKDETIKDLQEDLAKASEEEAELDKKQKVVKSKLIRGEVDQIKANCDRWKENMDRLAAEKETTLAKLSSAEVQLRGPKEKSSTQAKRIEELEIGLVEAKAEIEKTKVMADKSIAMYRADAEAAQMQLREASDRQR